VVVHSGVRYRSVLCAGTGETPVIRTEDRFAPKHGRAARATEDRFAPLFLNGVPFNVADCRDHGWVARATTERSASLYKREPNIRSGRNYWCAFCAPVSTVRLILPFPSLPPVTMFTISIQPYQIPLIPPCFQSVWLRQIPIHLRWWLKGLPFRTVRQNRCVKESYYLFWGWLAQCGFCRTFLLLASNPFVRKRCLSNLASCRRFTMRRRLRVLTRRFRARKVSGVWRKPLTMSGGFCRRRIGLSF